MMTDLEDRGRCRLLLRMPAWREELRRAADADFLEVCQDYELTWRAITSPGKIWSGETLQEYRRLADYLETEALYLAALAGKQSPVSSRR